MSTCDLHGKVFVAGHRGLVGSALVRRLQAEGATDLVLRTHAELDLANQAEVDAFFARERPDFVFLCAAKVGGIHANDTYPAEFIRDNLAIQTNVIHSAWKHEAKKLLFLGSSCIYPKLAPQPMREDALLTGPLEPTNEWYAIAKIAGVKMCQAYRKQYGFDAIVAMPTNLYGPGDNYHPENSHVVPALLRRFHEAKQTNAPEVVVWGTGKPMRELMHVDDLADALIFLMRNYSAGDMVNVGSGDEVSIAELAALIAGVVGYQGTIRFDSSKPDGTPRKLLDSSRLAGMGWRPHMRIEVGLRIVWENLAVDQSIFLTPARHAPAG
ncbi:MAG: GDP-L-fucose synthase [Proteobacteria bacterium]|nr:GDP-L-fucose synthase [Pseudomonadota bacterium]